MALRWSLVLMLCLTAGGVQAQKRTFKEKLIHFLDSSNVDRTDPAYITLPKRPWRVIASSSTDQMDLKLTSHQDYYFWEESSETNYHNVYDYRIVIKPPVATSVGLWAGYRGWGAGYSLSLTGNKGINLSFNISTPSNGVNIRIHRFDFDKPKTEL